ncbi:hypothetical protein BGX26_001556, partial [Mortierella sp. AD094]
MDTPDQRLFKHRAVVKRARRDPNLARRVVTIQTHLRRWCPDSQAFLEHLTAILVEAALVTEPDLIRKLKSLRGQAKKDLEIFLNEQNTLYQNLEVPETEQHDSHEHEADNEQEQPQEHNESVAEETTVFQHDPQETNTLQGQHRLQEQLTQQRQREPDGHLSLMNVSSELFINQWFYWMNALYMITSKPLVLENTGEHNRTGHLAYLVCYWNSHSTRKVMKKLDAHDGPDLTQPPVVFDPDNKPRRRRRRNMTGTIRRRLNPPKKPISFMQDPSSQGDTVKTILKRTYAE